MTQVQVPDEGGVQFTGIQHNGCFFPKFDIWAIKGLSSVKIREDDVLLLGYPKSGNHWVWEITRHILAGDIFNDDVIMQSMFIDCTSEDQYADIPSPRILTSHTQIPQLPPDVVMKKPKIINLLRNPKDIAVSFYTFMIKLPISGYSGKWDNCLKSFFKGKLFYGSWIDYVLSWENVKVDYPDWPILSVYYEDFVEDPVTELRKLCTFLGVPRSDDFLERVCQQCHLDNMRKVKATTEGKSLYFRKGLVGDWKNWFTVAQNEWFDQLYQEKMKDCQLQFRYTLD